MLVERRTLKIMKIRSFSTIVLILCFALLLISLVSCKEKEPELEENNTEYLFNPFDEINVVKCQKLENLDKSTCDIFVLFLQLFKGLKLFQMKG